MDEHHNHNDNHHHASSESSAIEYAKFAGVIAFIALAAWWLNGDAASMEYMRWFMGVFLVVFAGFKLAGYQMFVMMFAGYDIIAKRSKLYARAYPFIELGLGVLFLADLWFMARNILLLMVMSIGAVGVFQEIYHRRSGIHCACLGNIIKLPLSTVSLVEDVGMAAMALYMLAV